MLPFGDDADDIAGSIIMIHSVCAALYGIGGGRYDKVETRTKFYIRIPEAAIRTEGLDREAAIKLYLLLHTRFESIGKGMICRGTSIFQLQQ
jgi:hypothetical protein